MAEAEEVEIARASDADLSAVLRLWSEARSPYSTTSDDQEALGRLRAVEPESLLVAKVDGRLVGTLVATWDGWRGNMYRLAVADEHRRRGIASALVRDAERRLLARGARRVSALVGRGDETATAFWRAAGYQPDDGIRRYVRNLIEPR